MQQRRLLKDSLNPLSIAEQCLVSMNISILFKIISLKLQSCQYDQSVKERVHNVMNDVGEHERSIATNELKLVDVSLENLSFFKPDNKRVTQQNSDSYQVVAVSQL